MRDCLRPEFRDVYAAMVRLSLQRQPAWFRPLLVRSRRLKGMTGYDHWSRAWEYPWAVQAADLGDSRLAVLDVGGGGSPFAPYLAGLGHEAHVADPSLDQGRGFQYDPKRGLYRNARTLGKHAFLWAAGLHSLWGLPKDGGGDRLHYHPYSADRMPFPDARFDRVFCLSVIEHVTHDLWPACMREFERVLKPGGRLVITLDMETDEANARLYRKLVEASSLTLLGAPDYKTPLDPIESQQRHPRNYYETLGLVWRK